jgi:hypothetical protein
MCFGIIFIDKGDAFSISNITQSMPTIWSLLNIVLKKVYSYIKPQLVLEKQISKAV